MYMKRNEVPWNTANISLITPPMKEAPIHRNRLCPALLVEMAALHWKATDLWQGTRYVHNRCVKSVRMKAVCNEIHKVFQFLRSSYPVSLICPPPCLSQFWRATAMMCFSEGRRPPTICRKHHVIRQSGTMKPLKMSGFRLFNLYCLSYSNIIHIIYV